MVQRYYSPKLQMVHVNTCMTINQSGEGAIAMDTDDTVTELKNHLSAI